MYIYIVTIGIRDRSCSCCRNRCWCLDLCNCYFSINDLFYASEYLRTKTGKKCSIQLEKGDFAIATKALENPENLRVAYQAIVIEIVSKNKSLNKPP